MYYLVAIVVYIIFPHLDSVSFHASAQLHLVVKYDLWMTLLTSNSVSDDR
jgi:hypothetical protein